MVNNPYNIEEDVAYDLLTNIINVMLEANVSMDEDVAESIRRAFAAEKRLAVLIADIERIIME